MCRGYCGRSTSKTPRAFAASAPPEAAPDFPTGLPIGTLAEAVGLAGKSVGACPPPPPFHVWGCCMRAPAGRDQPGLAGQVAAQQPPQPPRRLPHPASVAPRNILTFHRRHLEQTTRSHTHHAAETLCAYASANLDSAGSNKGRNTAPMRMAWLQRRHSITTAQQRRRRRRRRRRRPSAHRQQAANTTRPQRTFDIGCFGAS